MGNVDIERICPSCGQTMERIETKHDKDTKGKMINRWEIWDCLNCSKKLEIDLMKNIWREDGI